MAHPQSTIEWVEWGRILSAIPAAVYACDAEGRLTMYNAAAAELWGRSPELGVEQWCGSTRIVRLDGRSMPLDECPMAIAIRERRPVLGEEIIVERPDGSRRFVLPHPQPLFDEDGNLTGAVNMLADITDRKRIEARDAFLVRLDDALRPLIDPEEVNQTAVSLLRDFLGADLCVYIEIAPDQREFRSAGGSNEELLSNIARYEFIRFSRPGMELLRTGTQFVVEDTAADPRCAEALEQYAELGVRSFVCVPLFKAGVFGSALAVHQQCPRVWRPDEVELSRLVAGRCWESIERCRTNRTLRESEARFRLWADAAPPLIWMSGTERRCTWFNKRWLDFVGRSLQQELASDPDEHIHPDDREACRALSRTAFAARDPFIMEFRLRRNDGEYRWMLDHGVPRFGADGVFLGYIGSCIDMTDRVVAERKLREREQYLTAIIENTPECIKIVAPDGTLRYMNPAGAGMIAAESGDAVVGRNMLDLVAPEHRAYYEERHLKICEGEKLPLEFDIVGLHGARRHMRSQAVPLPGADGTVDHLAITRDVTASKQIEDALRESEQRFRTIADNISQFAWMTDATGWISWYNQRWYDYTGTTIEQMRGWGWVAVHHPDHVDRVTRKFKEHIDAGEPWEDTFPLRSGDGEYRWFLSRALPIRDAEGRIQRWFGTNTDVTEQREAEQEIERYSGELEQRVEERTAEVRASHERLRLAERLAALGTLSAGLGHDMGNLLVPVRVCVEMLENADLSPEMLAHVGEIKTSAEYLQQLAGGLRLMAVDPERTDSNQTTDLEGWWGQALLLMKTALPRGILLETDFAPDCRARIPAAALTQAVFNLVQNAGSAMAPRGSGTVRVSGYREGRFAVVTVQDDGPGMSPEVRNHCMEPFFTTKPRGISTGLGLVLVAGLVRDAGGEVDLTSEPGAGTRFSIRLPLAAEPPIMSVDGATRPRAAILLRDARLNAFVRAELRALSFDIISNTANKELDLLVLEHGVDCNGTAARARCRLLVGGPAAASHDDLVVRARPSAIREALHTLARAGSLVEVRS